MRVHKVHPRRIVSSLLALTLSVTLLQAIPVAFPKLGIDKANASDNATPACPTVNGVSGTLSGTGPYTCSYSGFATNTGASTGIPQGTYITVTLVGGAGGGGGADNSVSGTAGGAGATLSNYRFKTASGNLFFCIGNGGSGGKAQDTGAGGGAGGTNLCNNNYGGGAGGGAGNYGNSGAGGGGGAATYIFDGTNTIVAGGGGGGAGGSNVGTSGFSNTPGNQGNSGGQSGTAGAAGTGKRIGSQPQVDDASGSGGGGGGVNGGTGGVTNEGSTGNPSYEGYSSGGRAGTSTSLVNPSSGGGGAAGISSADGRNGAAGSISLSFTGPSVANPTLSSSSASVGTALSATAGDVTTNNTDTITTSWQWYRQTSCTETPAAIANATTTSYTPTSSDLGSCLTVRQTSYDVTGAALGVTAISNATSAVTSTVTFDANGGTSSMTPQTSSSAANLTANSFTRSGYTFANWNTAANGTGTSYNNQASYAFTSSVTLYARWTANTNNAITYDNQSATTEQSGGSTFYTSGSPITTIPTTAPLKTGYTFGGWWTQVSGGGTQVTDGSYTPSPGGVTLYAKWTANTYTVTYNYNSATGGNATTSASYTTGGTAITLPTPTKTYYTFLGWYADSGFSTSIGSAGASYSPNGTTLNITLYAKWRINQFVYYYNLSTDSGHINAYDYSIGTTHLAVSNGYNNTGYKINAGWCTAATTLGGSCSGTLYLENDPLPALTSGDLILYAYWPVQTYAISVTQTSNGTIAPSTTSVNHNGSQTFTFTPNTGYVVSSITVDGIALSSSTTPTLASAITSGYTFSSVTATHTITATFSGDTTNPVVYDNHGATTPQSGGSTTYTTGQAIANIPTTAPIRTGYTFNGWYTSASGGTKVTDGSYTPGSTYGSITLHAQWTGNTQTITWSGSGNTGGSAPTSPTTVAYGSSFTLPTNTYTKTGYSFNGWLIGATTYAEGATYPSSGGVTGNVSVTAKWSVNAYFVYYDMNGGSCSSPIPAQANDYGLSITLASGSGNNCTKSNAVFVGWNTLADSTGTSYAKNATYTIGASNVTMYAVWIKVPNLTNATITRNPSLTTLSVTPGLATASTSTYSDAFSTVTTVVTVTATPDTGESYSYKWRKTAITGGDPAGTIADYGTGTNSISLDSTLYDRWIPLDIRVTKAGFTYNFVTAYQLKIYKVVAGTVANTASDQTASVGVSYTSPAFDYSGTETGTKTYSVVGTLPSGLTFNSSTHVISGTPTQYGVFPIQIKVSSDTVGDLLSSSFNLTVNGFPSAPTSLTASSNASTLSVISWAAPSSDGGSAVTGYSVTSSPTVTPPAGCTNISNTNCTFTGLTNGTTYIFSVTASNINGVGTAATVTATPATAPTAPQTFAATSNASGQSVLSWTAPSSDGGNAISGYTVTASYSGGSVTATGCTSLTSTSTGCTLTGLTNGTTYTFTVAATNNAGTGSTATATATPSTVPGAPTSVSGTSNENAQSTVTWSVPSSTGGAAITDYIIEYSVNGSTYTVFNDGVSTNTSVVVTGLSNAVAYYFRVKAVNASGNSSYGVTSGTATPALVLSKPAAPTVSAVNGITTQITVTFTADPSASYTQVKLYTSANGVTASQTVDRATSPYTFSALTAGTQYWITVTSTGNGSSVLTSQESDRTLVTTNSAAGTPQITTQPVGVDRTKNQQLSLSVSASSPDGGTLSYQWFVDNVSVSASNYATMNFGQQYSAGTFKYKVVVTNTKNSTTSTLTSSEVTVTIYNSLSATTPSAIYGTKGSALSFTLQASGGLSPYTFLVGSTALPAGLTLNSSTGVISGTPTTSGTTSSFTFQVRDSNYSSSNVGDSIVNSNSFSFVISDSMSYSALAAQSATVGTSYSTLFAVTGGRSSVTYSINSGALPTGLSLNTTTGLISGTPSADGTFTATIRATDANSATQDLATTFTVSKGAASTPTLGTVTRTADGFTSQITKVTNYNYSATTSAGSVAIDANGLITVTRLGVNSSATVTVTSTRSGYTDGTATVTGTSSQGTTTVSVALPSNATTATFGTAVTLTATATRAGTVTFKESGTAICTAVTISASPWTATCSWTPATVATNRSITAEFTPTDSPNYANSTSSAVTVNVGKAALSIPTVTAAPGAGSTTTLVLTFTHSSNSTGTYYALFGYASTGATLASGTVLVGTTTATITGLNSGGSSSGTTYYLEYYAVGNGNYNNSATSSPRDSYTTNPTWTINYDSTTNGGGVTTAGSFVPGSTALTLPTPAARNGYTANGWFDAASGGTKIGNAGASYTPTGSITLYFQWSATTYTITYNRGPDGVGNNTTQTFTVLSAATLLNSTDANAAFTRTGYSITGWTTSNTSGDAKTNNLNSSYSTLGDITFYPFWSLKSYVLTINSGSNYTFSGNGTFNYGTSKTVTFTAATGYTITSIVVDGTALTGTSLTSAIANGVTFNPLDADHTLSAVATGNTYSVTFDRNGGTSPSANETNTFTSGGSISKPTVPTRAGYLFLGWYDASTSGTKVSWPLTPSSYSNKTYYAYWKELSFTYNVATGNTGTVKASDAAKTIGLTVGQTLSLADATTIVGTTISTTWKTQNSLSGTASGTWSTAGTSSNYSSSSFDRTVADVVMITMEDSIVVDGDTITASFSTSKVSISTALTITAPANATLQINTASTTSASASGGKSAYTYSVASGTLPTGMALDPSTGSISMFPSAIGTFTFTLKATDANGATATSGTITYTVGKIQTTLGAMSDISKNFGDGTFVITNPTRSTSQTGTWYISSSNTAVATVQYSTNLNATVVGVGTTTISIYFVASDTINYATSSTTTFTLTVNKSNQVTLSVSTASGTYGTNLTLSTSGGSGTGSISYTVDSGPCTVSGTTLSSTGAGTCYVTATKDGDTTYNSATSASKSIAIGARPISLKANDVSVNYTGSSVSPTIGYTITSGSLVGTDAINTATISYRGFSVTYTSSTTAPTNDGTYYMTPSAMTFSSGSSSNYSITYSDAGILTISKVNLAQPNAPNVTNTPGVLKSLNVSWTAVTGASSYTIKVYNSTPSLVKTVTGASGTSATILDTTNFADDTSYTATVTAIGGTNYNDSVESSASTSGKTAKTYTITYSGNGTTAGTAVTSQSYITGGTAIAIKANTWTFAGYTFSSWNSAADGSGTAYSPTSSSYSTAADVTLYAQWTGNTYTITYKSSPSGTGADITQSFTYPGSLTIKTRAEVSSLITRSGYYITGWTTTSTAGGSQTNALGSSYSSANNRTLYPVWTEIPVFTSIEKTKVPFSGGGYNLWINGSFLGQVTAVSIGGKTAGIFQYGGSTSIQVSIPSFTTAGARDIVLTYPDGTVTAANAITYVAPPTITSFTPSSATVSGGTTITVTGADFTGTTGVTVYSGINATSFTVVSDTSLTFVTPAIPSGSQTFTITTPYGNVTSATGVQIDKLTQTVTWSPTTTLLATGSPATPSSLASSNGNGSITYSFVSKTNTSCSINSSTAVLTFSGTGDCVVRATAASTSTYAAGSIDVTFTISKATLTQPSAPTVTNTPGVLKSLDVSWTTVTGASSYTIKVYDSSQVLKNTTTLASGTSKTILDTTNFLDDTAYTVTVTAIGNATYNDSIASTSSTAGKTAKTYTISYGANNATSGTAPTGFTYITGASAVTVSSNSGTLARTGFTFAGWNTQADGNGTSYAAGTGTYNTAADATLYAKWTALVPTITSFTPTDPTYGSTVTITGTNFSGATNVKIGTVDVASFTVVSSTSITFVDNDPFSSAKTITVITPGGSATSVATLSSRPQLPTITTQPQSVTKAVGDTVTFTVVVTAVSDGGTLSYQWKKGLTDISGATSATYSFTSTGVTDAGDYSVLVYNKISTGTSYVTSNAATLTMTKGNQSTLTVTSTTGTYGTSLTLTSSGGTISGSVTYSTSTGGCTITSGVLTTSGAVTCVVTASMAGNTDYNSVSSSATNVVIGKANQAALDFLCGSCGGTPSASAGFTGSYSSAQSTYGSYQRYELSTTNIGSGTGAYTYSITSGTATNCQIGSGSTPSNIGTSYLQSSNSTNSIIWVLASTVGTCNLTLTRAADANYNSISVTALFTFNKANQSVTFSSKPTAITWGDTPAKVTATSTSGNTVSYRVGSTTICSLSGDTFTILKVGTCHYYTSALGNDNYSALSENYWDFAISAKALTLTATDQSINYGASVTKAFTITSGALVGSDAISGVTYTYAGISPTVYTSSTTVPTAPGSYTITISSALMSSGALTNYTVTYATGTLTISKASQASLSVSSTSGTYGTSLSLTSTGGTTSGSITYTTSTAGCSISAGALTSTSATTCVVTATMAGNTNYNDVSSTATNVVIAARPITLTVGNQSTAFTGSSVSITNSFTRTSGTLAGSDAISGMTYTFTSGGGYNSTTAPTNVGTYTISGSAAVFSTGTSSNYEITYINGTLTISASSQSITFTGPTSKTYGDLAFTVSPTASSSLTVVLASTTTSVCTVSSFTVTIVTPGTCTLTADQSGNSSFSAATQVSRSFTVAQAAQATLTISATTTSATSTGTAFTATPTFTTGSSGSGTGAVTYAVITGGTATCTLSNSSSSATLTATTAGTCLIAATKASDTNYLSATSSNLTFTFTTAAQTITFTAPSTTQFSAGTVSVSGTSSSGLTVTFTSGSTSVCTVSGTTVTFVSAGSCVINADQSGNTYYAAATQVQRTFTVSAGTQATLTATASVTSAAYTGTAYTAVPSLSTGSTGSGTGAVTYAIATGGSATSCALDSSAATATLTANSSGTCYIKATKASDSNYNSADSANLIFTFTKATLATPSAPTVVATTGLATSISVSWTAVANATSYSIKWYDSAGTTLVSSQSVSRSLSNFDVTGLTSNTTYQFSLTAVASGEFLNSAESIKASVTTRVQPAIPSLSITYQVGSNSSVTVTSGNALASITQGQSIRLSGTTSTTDAASLSIHYSPTINGVPASGGNSGSSTTFSTTISIDNTYNVGSSVIHSSCTSGTTYSAYCFKSEGTISGVVGRTSWIGIGFNIYAALTKTDPATQNGTVGSAITGFTPSVSGGKSSYTYQRVQGLMPPGLSLNATTGEITGTPTASGNYGPVIRVTDANGASIDVTVNYAITALTQTITFTQPADKTYGDSAFTVAATSNSNLTVAFTSATTGVCTVSGTTVTILTAGTCTLNANQAGDSAYSAATQVQQSFAVNKASQATVNIAAGTNSAAYTGSAFTATPTLSSTGGSGNGSVTYAIVSGGTAQGCTLTSGTLTATSVGTCLIAATKASDTNYLAGTSGNLTFTFTVKTQTITFGSPADITFGATPASLSATSTSTLTVAFTSATTNVCTVSGTTVTILTSGTCTINADQAGDSNYSAATQVSKSFTVAKATPVLSSLSNATKNYGDSAFTITDPSITGSIPGTFTYTSATTAVATVSGASVTPAAVGTSVITALFTPTDTGKYNTSTVTMTLTVAQRTLAQPNAPNATATAGVLKSFAVTWTAVTNAVAYALKIYAADGTTLLQTVSGLSGTSKTVTVTEFSTIVDNTGYKVGIVATGDTNNADSIVSTLSSLVTTNKSYVITYNANNSTGGTAPASGSWITGASATTVASNSGTLVRTGYTFAGWNSAALGTGTDYVAGTGTYSTAADITLYAKWTAGAITITYNPDFVGGTNVTESKTADTAFNLRSNSFTRPGFTFAGWATTSGGSSSKADGASVTVLVDTTYYAVWTAIKYTVTYNSNNGTGGTVPSDATEYLNGGTITVKADTGALSRTGYSFQGWADNSNGTGTLYLPSLADKTYTVNLSNVTFYAVWAKVTYQVSYNVDGGSSVLPGSYQIGDSITLPAAPTKAGYTFAGWFAASSGGSALSTSYSPSGTGNISIYARWTAVGYTVTYNGNGNDSGSVPTNSSTYTIGSSIPVAGNSGTLAKAGYTFAGWTVASDGTGTVLSSSSTVTTGTSNVTFYAKWSPVAYTVTYSTAGSTSGTAPTDSNNYNIGNTVSVSSNSGPLVKTGYTFAGWTTASDGTGTVYSAGNAFTVATANITFYSKWTANTYTVTFDANGASGSASKTNDTFTSGGTEVTLGMVGTMAKTGYQFAGWATSANGTALSGTFATTSNATLYALWTAIPYTITYDPNGGTSTPTQDSLTMGQSFTLASGITKANGSNGEVYAFVGWSYNNSTYQPGYSITVGTSNITLTAVFIRVFTVKYSLNGSTDTPAADQLKNDGDRITTAAAPSRAGYVFAGWIDQSGQTFNAGVQYTVGLQHYLLYAQWSAINYQITYDAAGGSTTPIQAAKNYGQTFTVTNAVSRTGYTFAGWSDGTTTFGAGATYLVGTSDITFTAQWTANVYTVSYDFNGGTGSAISNSSFTVGGTAITLPLVGDRVRTNYTFGGWSTSPTGTSLGTTYSPTASTTLYAVWTLIQYVVTYDRQDRVSATSNVTYNAGGSALTLPTLTRASYVFDGWYSASTGGTLVGLGGASFVPSSARTLYAKWTQLSLSGLNPGDMTKITSGTAQSSITSTYTFNTTDSSVSVEVPAGSLPNNTALDFYLLATSATSSAKIPTSNGYILSLVIAWVAPDGTVPVTAPGKAISMTVTNTAIKKGASVYAIAGSSVQFLGVATQDGTVTVSITEDPEVVIVKTKPTAPRNVAGTATDGVGIVNWSAPLSDGGSPLLGYEVYLSGVATPCITTTLTCTFTGLTNGTSYTVSVRAYNAIDYSEVGTGTGGTSFTSTSSTPPTPTPPTPTPPTPTQPTTPSTPPVAEPIYLAPAFETANFARSVVFADAKFELPGKTTTGSVLKWRTTSSACSVTTAGMITWNSTGLCSLIASVGAAEIAYAIQIDPRTEVTVQEITQVQSSNMTVNATVKWPGQAFDLRFCVGKSTNKCLFNKVISINSLEGQTLTADGDLYITTTIAGLSPRSEYDVFATVIATNKSLASNVRSIKTPAGIAAAVSGATTIILGQDLGLAVDVSGEGSVTSLRAVGLPAGVSIARTATGGSITGKPRATGVYFVTVKLTDSFRQMTDLPVTIVVNQVGSVSAIVNGAIYKPTSANTTLVSWKNIAAVKSIQVKLGASVVCTTTATSCVVKQLLGPKSTLQIIATNSQGALANPVLPNYVAPKKLVEVGTANFATNSTVLSTAQKNAFKKVAADMEAKGFTQLTVYGYSDQTGTKATNDKISLARATAIYDYLKVLLAEKQLTVTLIGKGFKDPVASNATAKGRAANRRAVVSIG